MHEWVQRQRPNESLSILHRLDKATSGLLLFGKTAPANRSLAQQFESRTVAKRYELLVEHDDRRPEACDGDEPIRVGARRQPRRTDFRRRAVGRGCRALRRPSAHRPHPPGAGARGRRWACRSSATTSTAASMPPGCSCTRPGWTRAPRREARSSWRPAGPPASTGCSPAALRPTGPPRHRGPGRPRGPGAAVRPGRHRRLPLDRPPPRRLPRAAARTARRRGPRPQLRRRRRPIPPTWLDAWNDTARPASGLRAAPTTRRRRRAGPAGHRPGRAPVRGHRAGLPLPHRPRRQRRRRAACSSTSARPVAGCGRRPRRPHRAQRVRPHRVAVGRGGLGRAPRR